MATATILGYLGATPKLEETGVDQETGEVRYRTRLRVAEKSPKDRETKWFWATAFGWRAEAICADAAKRSPIALIVRLDVWKREVEGQDYPHEEIQLTVVDHLVYKTPGVVNDVVEELGRRLEERLSLGAGPEGSEGDPEASSPPESPQEPRQGSLPGQAPPSAGHPDAPYASG